MKFFHKHKWLKITLLSLLIVIGFTSFMIDVILEGIIKERLTSAIQQQEDRLYDYKFENVTISFLKGEVVLEKLEIIPRQEIIDSLKAQGDLKQLVYHIQLDYFKLNGLHTWQLILKNEIHIEYMNLDRAVVEIYNRSRNEAKKQEHIASEIIAPTLKLALIDSFSLNKSEMRYYTIVDDDDTIRTLFFDSLDFSLYGLRIDSNLIAAKTYFDYESISLSIQNIELDAVKDFHFELARFQYDPEKSDMTLSRVQIRHKLDKYAFMKAQSVETDWINIDIRELIFRNIDFKKYQFENVLLAARMEIIGPNIELYRDKRLEDAPSKYKPIPFAILRNLDFKFAIDKIVISDGEISYYERNQEANRSAIVSLDKLNADITGVNTLRDSTKDLLEISAECRFMKAGRLKLKIQTNILDTTNKFIAEGKLEALPFSKLNELTEPMAFIKFEEGQLNYISFNMIADENESNGRLDIDYSGLKGVTLIKKESEIEDKESKKKKNQVKKEKKFISFLANTLIQNDYNPDSKKYVQGRIHFERNKDKAIFNYLVKSIQSGLMSSLMPKMQENWKEVKKEIKAEKKAERKSEKAEKKEGKRKSKDGKKN